jgi:hypothetical protein
MILLILVLLAKDKATIREWKNDPEFQKALSNSDTSENSAETSEISDSEFVSEGGMSKESPLSPPASPEDHLLADIYYDGPHVPMAFFHRAVKFKGIDLFGTRH